MVLETTLCGKSLKSPLILGSGTLGERKQALIKSLGYGAGAVVSRTLRVDNTGREVFRPSSYIEEGYMLNADNTNITPWTYWIDEIGDVERSGPLVMSLSARNPDDCDMIVLEFEAHNKPSFYEVNFSCSHSARLYGRISYRDAERSLKNVRRHTSSPVFLKFSIDDLRPDEARDLEPYFDAYVVSNTIGPGMKIDVNSRRPAVGSLFGGLSGAAIKPLVLAKIYELRQHTDKPIIGVGGIETPEDVMEYIILGCEAVQIYTAAHRRGVRVFDEIYKGLKTELEKRGETVDSLRGTLRDS